MVRNVDFFQDNGPGAAPHQYKTVKRPNTLPFPHGSHEVTVVFRELAHIKGPLPRLLQVHAAFTKVLFMCTAAEDCDDDEDPDHDGCEFLRYVTSENVDLLSCTMTHVLERSSSWDYSVECN